MRNDAMLGNMVVSEHSDAQAGMEPGTTGHCRPVKVPRRDLSTPLRIELGGSRVEDEIVSQGEGLASRGERWDATVYFAQPSECPSA